MKDTTGRFLVALCLLARAVGVVGESEPGSRSTEKVCRRWGHSSALYDDIIYVYSGNVWRSEDDIKTLGERSNVTLDREFVAIDVSRDFDIGEIPITSLSIPPRPGPPKVQQATFWVDESQGSLLLYGGSFSLGPEPRSPDDIVEDASIWSYRPKVSSWEKKTTTGDTVLRATGGASTYYKKKAFYRGGEISNLTTPGWPGGDGGRLVLNGMVTYDIEKGSFKNKTDGFEAYGTKHIGGYKDGTIVPITFGGRDYLISLAGGGQQGNALELNNVYIYDIANDAWFKQPVDGERPINTRGACAVVNYASDDSSIQITLFGGRVWKSDKDHPDTGYFVSTDNIWVLSIPSFTWIPIAPATSADNTTRPGPLQDHTCHMSGSQLLIVGGRSGSKSCNSGLWIYDTSTLSYKSTFSSTSSYTVPPEVFTIIGGSGSGGAPWESRPLIAPPDTNSPFTDIMSYRKKKPPIGAIVGGVVGGLLFVGALVLTWWLWRNQKRRIDMEDTPVPPAAENYYIEKPGNQLGDNLQPAQLYGDSSQPVELASGRVEEMGETRSPLTSMGTYELPVPVGDEGKSRYEITKKPVGSGVERLG